MAAAELCDLGIGELGRRYRARELSPVDVAAAHLARIERLDKTLSSYLTVTPDRALADARAAEIAIHRGDAGPLAGVPIAYKDLYATRGVRTTAGSALLADWVPDHDATCVSRLQQAGMVMLGKLTTHEFAFGIQFPGHRFLPARNPWNLDHIPGGSSSGSGAALAAGLTVGALGSDTGGAIRGPAAFCGIVGLKPPYRRGRRIRIGHGDAAPARRRGPGRAHPEHLGGAGVHGDHAHRGLRLPRPRPARATTALRRGAAREADGRRPLHGR